VNSPLPPALNIIALATFAASLSARALDPVLPNVADEFGVSIATAAGFSAAFAIHGCLQVFASELSVEARATALSLPSFFFFMGQTLGRLPMDLAFCMSGRFRRCSPPPP